MVEVDVYGRVLLDADEIFAALYRGDDISGIFGSGEEVTRYNELCRFNDKTEYEIPLAVGEGKTNSERLKEWMMPDRYRDIDIWKMLEERCENQDQKTRIMEEQIEYEKRDLNDLLRLMVYLVDHFRENKIVWGVGRGSSVASLALYLIGITKINPMRYGLVIGDFLKD